MAERYGMDEEQRAAWQRFITGSWTKAIPTEEGRYYARFGVVLVMEVYDHDGALHCYHPSLGKRAVEEFFGNRWRWSEPIPEFPESPR